MKNLLAISILFSNFFSVLATLPANAAAPPPKFLSVGSANACIGGSSATMSDFVIDPLSGFQYVLTDSGNGVCRSTDHGVTWAAMNTGGPLTCPPGGAVKLKKFNFMQDGTLAAFTGTNSCGNRNAVWWLDNVANPAGPNTWTLSPTPLLSATLAIFGHGANLGAAGGFVAPLNAKGYVTLDNGRHWADPTTWPASPPSHGDIFGSFQSNHNHNIVYTMAGGNGGIAGCPPGGNNGGIVYTTDANGANWTLINNGTTNGMPCSEQWTPIILPPNQGANSGKGFFVGSPGGLAADNKAWAFGNIDTPATQFTWTDLTGNLYSGRTGGGTFAITYDNFTTGIDWNYRIFGGSMSQNQPGTPAYAPVYTDTLPTWGQTDTVTGNNFPSFYTAPCNVATPRPNSCIAVSFVVDKYPLSPTYGKMFTMMRNGDVYVTELPQSHMASSFSWPAGALTVGVGNTTGPEQVVVSYLDQDMSDPTCPAITGDPPLYPSRSAGVFSSSNPSIATVNATTGLITGVAAGSAYPLFTCGGVTSSPGPAITVTASLDAELPRVYIDSTYSLPDGKTWAAHDVAQFRTALINSVPGDVIVLDAGATYSGSFTLPAKTNPNNKWIYIMSSQLANLPAGTRVSPANAIYMPRIVAPGATPTITVAYGANYWRLAGLEITAASNYPAGCGTPTLHCMTYFLMNIAGTSGALADHIYVDRVYGHGGPLQDLQGGIITNWNDAALVDSYIDDLHIKTYDSVGTGCYRCLGPIKIVNNYISSSTENIMFGGAGGNGNPGVPSDIEIRDNYLYKPLSWVTESVTNNSMAVKNAFQVSSGQRILFDSNVIENVWAHAQLGYAIVLTVRSGQGGDFSVVNDVTITNNVLKNVVSGISSVAEDDTCGPPPGGYPSCHNPGSQDRWNIANNLILFYDPKILGGNRNVVLAISGGLNRLAGNTPGTTRDIVFQHNTAVSAASTPCWNSIYFSSNGQAPPFAVPITNNVWILDNVLCDHPTGDYGFTGTTGLKNYMGNPSTLPNDFNARFYGNVIWAQPGETVPSYPATDLTQAAPFTYVNPSAMDYQLLTPVWMNTTDGKQAGIDNSDLPNH